MIPIDFQVTCSKVKVKPLFWSQHVVHFIPLILIPCLLASDRFCFYREDKPEFSTMGAYMLLEHFLLKVKMKYFIPDLLFCHVLFKVSSKPKSWSINKWWFFISAFNIHPQIFLILLNVLSFYNLYKNFADKCVKVK